MQFDSERCAEEAKNTLQNINFSGLRLNIEWSKNSGRFNENSKLSNNHGGRERSRSRGRDNGRDNYRGGNRDRTSWRKEEKYFRRSPSYERRHAPSYSDNEDTIDSFVPTCPRDIELLRRLRAVRDAKINAKLNAKLKLAQASQPVQPVEPVQPAEPTGPVEPTEPKE